MVHYNVQELLAKNLFIKMNEYLHGTLKLFADLQCIDPKLAVGLE